MDRIIRRIAAIGVFTAFLAAASMPSMAQNSHTLPLVLPASNGAQTGFVRIINNSFQSGTVQITAIDDTGERFGPVTLNLESEQTINFNSRDLESGNARKRLSRGVGDGSGSWRLILETALNITPLAYIRTSDGFVTAMHDIAPETEAGSLRYQVVFFNPGSNTRQVSMLRLINPGTMQAQIEITGRDDAGTSSGPARISIVPGGARFINAKILEDSGLGDGAGKWILTVMSNVEITVMNLLATPTGHLANLSAVPGFAATNTPVDPVTPSTLWGAIATGYQGNSCSDGWRFGVAWGYPNRYESIGRAIIQCNNYSRPSSSRPCSVRETFTICGSLAYTPSAPGGGCKLTGASGSTANSAEQAAIAKCRSDGSTGCRIATNSDNRKITYCNSRGAANLDTDTAYNLDGGSSLADFAEGDSFDDADDIIPQ